MEENDRRVLEILLVEDDAGDTILIHEIMGERPGSQV
jgi:hypothetical protein